jgi:hypothetical protein
MADSNAFVCLYQGPPGECKECGGSDPTGTGFCDHDCATDFEDRQAARAAVEQQRRDREDAFAREVARLRGEGYGDLEIDLMLADMPT